MKLFCLGALVAASACAPKEPAEAPESATEKPGDPPAALVERPVPARGTPERPPVDEARKLPDLCPPDDVSCEPFRAALEALEEGKAEQAREQLDSLSPPEAGRARGIYLILKGRARLESDSLAYGEGGKASEEALAIFQVAGETADLRDVARLQVARAHLSLGQGDRAVADLASLGEKYQGDAEVQASLGIAYLSTGRAARALAPLRRAAKLDPEEPERLIVLGTTHMLLGDLSQAERQFRAAVSLDGTSARAHGDLGAVLLVQGKIPQGKAHLERATQLAPERATYAANLSYAEILGERPKEAERQARRAIELDPELASAWLNLGLAQVALGQRKAARASFEKAKDLDPSDPRPANNLKDLDELEAQSETSP